MDAVDSGHEDMRTLGHVDARNIDLSRQMAVRQFDKKTTAVARLPIKPVLNRGFLHTQLPKHIPHGMGAFDVNSPTASIIP